MYRGGEQQLKKEGSLIEGSLIEGSLTEGSLIEGSLIQGHSWWTETSAEAEASASRR